MKPLYEISFDLQKILQAVDDNDGELTEELEKQLDGLQMQFEGKLENIGKLMRNIEVDVDGFKSEEKRLASRRTALENLHGRLKTYVKESMEAVGNTKVNCGVITFAIQKNPPSINVINQDDIPKNYFIEVDPKLDSKAVLAKLKAGEDIPGVELVTDKTHLRLR